MSGVDTWPEVRDVLCVRLDNLGDVLMTEPAMRSLRQTDPSRRVTLLASPQGAGIASMLGCVDDLLVHDAPWVKASAGGARASLDIELVAQLREREFDAAVIFTVYSQSALPAAMLCYLAGIPLRLAHCRENPYALLTHWQREPEPEQLVRHEVRRQLDLVASVGAARVDERIRLDVPRDAAAAARGLLRDAGVDAGQPWVLVHPGSTAPSRRYPAVSFAAAVRALVDVHGVQVVLSGSGEEIALASHVADLAGVATTSIAGRCDLPTFCGVIAEAPVLIANNSGPAHMAAGLGTPVVSLYALTNPQHRPWQVPTQVLNVPVPCSNCYASVCPEQHHRCLAGVAPSAVVEAALDLLEPPAASVRVAQPSWAASTTCSC